MHKDAPPVSGQQPNYKKKNRDKLHLFHANINYSEKIIADRMRRHLVNRARKLKLNSIPVPFTTLRARRVSDCMAPCQQCHDPQSHHTTRFQLHDQDPSLPLKFGESQCLLRSFGGIPPKTMTPPPGRRHRFRCLRVSLDGCKTDGRTDGRLDGRT